MITNLFFKLAIYIYQDKLYNILYSIYKQKCFGVHDIFKRRHLPICSSFHRSKSSTEDTMGNIKFLKKLYVISLVYTSVASEFNQIRMCYHHITHELNQ